MTYAVIFCESSINGFGMSTLGAPEMTGLCTKTTLPSFSIMYIKSAAHKYWDNPCNTNCNNGKIYKVLKRLAARNTSMEITSSKFRILLPRSKTKLMLFCNASRKKRVLILFQWAFVMATPTLMPRSSSQNSLRL